MELIFLKQDNFISLKQCFEQKNDQRDSLEKRITESAFAVSLPSFKIQSGSLCEQILHDYCVVCSKLLTS